MPRHLVQLTKLTWIEIKVFLREPLGAIGTVLIPVVVFVVLSQFFGGDGPDRSLFSDDLPVFAVILAAIGAVLSLTTIIAIYREGGILKRLKATPLSPLVILSTHVVVKILLTSVTLVLLLMAGRRFYSGAPPAAPWSFFLGLVLVTVSLLSLGFVLASVVRTARFAQPVGSIFLYTLLAVSGLFFPLSLLPKPWQIAALASPLTHAVALLRGLWDGTGWTSLWIAVLALVANFVVCTALSARLFRWE